MSVDDLPHGWTTCFFDQLISPDGTFVDGDWVESKDQDPNGDVRLIQLADVGDGCFLDKSARFLTNAKAAQLGCTYLQQGDILVARMPDPLGRACIFPLPGSQMYVTVVDVCIIRPDARVVDRKYLAYAINSPQIRIEIEKYQSGSTRKRISRGNLAKIAIRLPPLAEQTRIVAKIEEMFSELESGTENLTIAREKLNAFRQAVVTRAFEGKMTAEWRERNVPLPAWISRPPRVSETTKQELPALPSGWAWEALGNLDATVSDGPFGSNLKTSDYVEKGVRVIRLENIGYLRFITEKCSYITEEKYELLKNHTVRAGDIAFSSFVTDGTRVAILPDSIDRAVNKADCFCVRLNGNDVRNDYLATFLSSRAAYRQIEPLVHGVGRPRINTTQLKQLRIPMCARQEQDEIMSIISDRLSLADHLAAELDEQVAKSAGLRRAILQKAFSGALVEQNPQDEPAAVSLARIKTGTTGQIRGGKSNNGREAA